MMQRKKAIRALTLIMDKKICPKSKRSQLKIQQMAFMLMAVTLFFVLAGMFFLVIRFSGLKEMSRELEEKNAMLLVSKLSDSPEFSCGKAFGIKTNCIDADKVMILKDNEKYQEFWDVAEIQIRKIYPDNGNIICNFENYDSCGVIEVFSRNVNALPSVGNFASLCRKESFNGRVYDKCELAKLMVSGEDKS